MSDLIKDFSDLTFVGAQFEDSGVGWYRIIQPLAVAHRYLGLTNDGLPFEGKNQTQDFNIIAQSLAMKMQDAHILWTTKVSHPAQIEVIMDLKKKYRFKWWMDLDDNLINLNPDNPAYDRYFPYMRFTLMGVKLCDLLTVSTPILKGVYETIRTGPIEVTPNFVDESLWAKHVAGKKLTVGFAGAAGHEDDLRLLRNVLPRKDCQYALFGQPYEVPKPDAYYRWVGVQEYFQTYPRIGFDIAIAPLRNNVYNRCKSNLRIIEAGIQGIPVIASPVDPYLGMPVRYASSEDEWEQHLDELIASPKKRKEEGLALKEHILSSYSAKPFAEKFAEIITSAYQGKKDAS